MQRFKRPLIPGLHRLGPYRVERARGGPLGDYAENPNTHPPGHYDEREVFNRDASGDWELFLGPARRMAQYAFVGSATATLALPANYRRCYLLIQNNTAATSLYFGFGAGITATTGFQILSGGGNFLADYNAPTDDIYIFFAGGALATCIIGEGVYQ